MGRLVSPQGSNAYDAYKLVLEIDPTNKKAQQGLEKVSDKLYQRTQALMAEGNMKETQRHLDLALNLFPQHDGLLEMRVELERKMD